MSIKYKSIFWKLTIGEPCLKEWQIHLQFFCMKELFQPWKIMTVWELVPAREGLGSGKNRREKIVIVKQKVKVSPASGYLWASWLLVQDTKNSMTMLPLRPPNTESAPYLSEFLTKKFIRDEGAWGA